MKLIDDIIAREGGFVNHPDDKGGPTNFGITQRTLADFRKAAVTVQDVKNLTRAEAVAIYEAIYVKPFVRFAGHVMLHDLCVDSAVQHGVGRVDGWLKAIPSPDPDVNYKLLLRKRITFYGEIITANPSQAVFAKGWLNRVADFVR